MWGVASRRGEGGGGLNAQTERQIMPTLSFYYFVSLCNHLMTTVTSFMPGC